MNYNGMRVCGFHHAPPDGIAILRTYDDEGNRLEDFEVDVPDLLRERDELREALAMVTAGAERINALQHAGAKVYPELWSDLFDASNAARALLAKVQP